MPNKNIIDIRIEVCHANNAGVAVYAYFHKEPTNEDWDDAKNQSIEFLKDEKLGLDPNYQDEFEDRDEVPNRLSRNGGWRRYYLGCAS